MRADALSLQLPVAQAHAFTTNPKADAGELDANLHQAVLHFEVRRQNWNENSHD
jgi:hypothetical protein